jgi:hypothetical protein
MGISFSISQKAITYLIQSSGHSILEDSKLSGVLEIQGWVVWIHEKLQFDPLRLIRIRAINLFHLLQLGNKRNRKGGLLRTEGGKAAVDLENLLIAIV